MLTFLYSLPDLTIAILFPAVLALVFAAAPIVRAGLFGPVSRAHSSIALATLTTTTSFTALILAFTLVQAHVNLRSVQQTVAGEAIELNQIDRLLTRYGDPKVKAIREAVHAYADSIVADEWPQLAVHSSSQHTADLFRMVSQSILAIEPASARQNVIYTDLVKITDQLAESREYRLNETDLALQPIFWQVIAVLILLLVCFACFVEPRLGRCLSLGGLGAALAVLIALVFIFDQPFLGHSAITADPIVKTLAIMRARTS